jgi:hypothetical protein
MSITGRGVARFASPVRSGHNLRLDGWRTAAEQAKFEESIRRENDDVILIVTSLIPILQHDYICELQEVENG